MADWGDPPVAPIEWHYSVTSGGTIMGAATVNAAGMGWWPGEQPCEEYLTSALQPGALGTMPPMAVRHLRSVPELP